MSFDLDPKDGTGDTYAGYNYGGQHRTQRLRPIGELYLNAERSRDFGWLQVQGVGPNGKFHKATQLLWGSTQDEKYYTSALCSAPSLCRLDELRPFDPRDQDNKKCKACLKAIEKGTEVASINDRIIQGSRADAARARIDRHLREAERAEQELAFYESLPSEPEVEDGEPNVIWFRKRFKNGSVTYTYAACKAGDGLWYTTGPNVPKGFTWQKLVEWIFDGEAADLWHAASYNALAAEETDLDDTDINDQADLY